jgi:hypothetical protein
LKLKYFLLFSLIIPVLSGTAFGHTEDSVGDYRLEIGWMNEPVVSGETNGIELFVSPLEPGLDLKEQVFKDGISGLSKTLKMQLILEDQKITLPLQDFIKQMFWETLVTQQLVFQCILLKWMKEHTLNFQNHLI